MNVHSQRKDAIDNVLAFQVCAAIVRFTIYGGLSEKMSQEIGTCCHYGVNRRKDAKQIPLRTPTTIRRFHQISSNTVLALRVYASCHGKTKEA